MKKTVYSYFLGLALLVAGCGGKDGPAPAALVVVSANTGARYVLDGRATTATATSTFYTPATSPGGIGTADLMAIMLAAQPTGGATEYVRIIFSKNPGAAESTYRPQSLAVDGITGSRGGEFNNPHALTLTKSADGWSGTFEGIQTGSGGQTIGTLKSGVFTNVRP